MKETETKEFSEKRKFKLPKIELKKFTGDAKEYLSFWSQFRKVHEDVSIPNEDCCFSVTYFSDFCKVKNSCLYCAKPHHYLMRDHPKENINQKSDVVETISLPNSCGKNNA
ncbi:hypothetical protein AVEN_198857-1 [Araneus ventricosus]|uniref:Uncharacterized protein n=1 Tax=Araneus ventricosus TaxID=182803 RepID=A0A4Y2MMX0_ARAVE|nr:hypothetical protein AVEN_198857-1 [Araneus ventricosus]